MIDIADLLTTAEHELRSSDTLVRTTKAGILFGVLSEAIRRYTHTPVTTGDVLTLMTVLVRDGKLLDSLPRVESNQPLARLSVPREEHEPISPTHSDHQPTPEDDAERLEDIRVMRANGYSDTEIEAILALKEAATAGTEVVSRTDADLARHEEEQGNPFPGVPNGLQLRPNSVTSDFTMTSPDPVPSDLAK